MTTSPSEAFVKGHLGATPTSITGLVRLHIPPLQKSRLTANPILEIRFSGYTRTGFRFKRGYGALIRSRGMRERNWEERRLIEERKRVSVDLEEVDENTGEWEVGFKFPLPKILPPSFESDVGVVGYVLSGELPDGEVSGKGDTGEGEEFKEEGEAGDYA
ncbi:hypothetical protein HDV05_007322 [Chytridiales sp. JEL 0842]|nr:hypothetical protein HDV05_007322 [Chytridiales sp. JEL 0842]